MLALLPQTGVQWLVLVVSYLLGAIPSGLILGFLVRGVDVRRTGSGNIGATNVGRALGRSWAFVAFVFDFGKGWIPVQWLAPTVAGPHSPLVMLCGCAAVCGHVWPVYLRFRGGKGVATLCGAVAAIDPWIFAGGGLVWLVTLSLTRFVGLSSMMMGLSFPFLAHSRLGPGGFGMGVVWGTAALAAVVVVRHRSNIGRMLTGTEPKFGQKAPRGAANPR